MKTKIILTFVTTFFLVACNGSIKFEKAGWIEKGDLGLYPKREKMLYDLTTNYKLKGLSYKQLIDLIGQPEKNAMGSNSIYYNISVDYGHDIDPIYIKTFVVEFNNDTVKQYKINEWKE